MFRNRCNATKPEGRRYVVKPRAVCCPSKCRTAASCSRYVELEKPSIPMRIFPKCGWSFASRSWLQMFVKQCSVANIAWAMFTSSVAGISTRLVRWTRGSTWRHAVGDTGRNASTFGRPKPCPKFRILLSVRSQVTTGASPITNGRSSSAWTMPQWPFSIFSSANSIIVSTE